MLAIPSFELHVTHACNLACESCQHYTNQHHKGMVSLDQAESWMRHWSGRLLPKNFELLGGEPAIHPQLSDFVRLARRYFPHSQVRVLSNGFLLNRHPDLPVALKEVGNSRLDISIHHGSWQYGALIAPALQLIEQWVRDHGIQVKIKESFKKWAAQYRGSGADMLPFEDHNPQASWDTCGCKRCFQLLDGAVWKCPPLAYLPMQHAKYGLSEKWRPYLEYQPLQPGCSDEELRAFFAQEAESVCSMCPAYPRLMDMAWPLPQPAKTRT